MQTPTPRHSHRGKGSGTRELPGSRAGSATYSQRRQHHLSSLGGGARDAPAVQMETATATVTATTTVCEV